MLRRCCGGTCWSTDLADSSYPSSASSWSTWSSPPSALPKETTMLAHLRPALIIFALFTVLTGLAYPLAMTGIAQALFPRLATGSMIAKGDGYVGSELIGQANASERYFHPRPSA